MKSRSLVLLAAFLPWFTACATPATSGPGMIVTFRNAINGKALFFDKAITANGTGFSNPGSLSPGQSPSQGGATEGAVPDGRMLPDWVEFSWKEWPYPRPPMPRDQEGAKIYSEEVRTISRALPRKTGRVIVRGRVPDAVVAEIVESNRHREKGKTPEKMLWVYFIWYENEIKFKWELKKDCCTVLRSGGDEV